MRVDFYAHLALDDPKAFENEMVDEEFDEDNVEAELEALDQLDDFEDMK